jgi:hypothetical protein
MRALINPSEPDRRQCAAIVVLCGFNGYRGEPAREARGTGT